MDDPNSVLEISRLAIAGATAQVIGDTPFIVVPEDFKMESIESLLQAPTRKRGQTQLRDADSFCRYINDQKTPATKLYGNKTVPSFAAVFNDHATEPGWLDYRATYQCPLSVEWKTWTASNKTSMSQEKFAQFIEDNAPDCVSPDSATMIEISRTLEAKKKVNFASSVRLRDGASELTYEEEISGTASKGKLQIPDTFQIGIAVLEGGPRYAMHARLRFRIGDKGALAMWFDLDRPHKVIEDAVNEVWASIEVATGLSIFNGG